MGWSKNTTVRKLNGQSALTVADLELAAAVLDVSVLAFVQPVTEPVREAGHAYPVLIHLCLALAVVALLAAALPAQALAFVTGGALAVVVSGTATLAVGVVRTLRSLDDHP